MSELRTAALRALEALEWFRREYRDIDGGTRFDWTDQAAEDLRAALNTKVDSEPIAKLPPEAQTEAEKIAYCAGWWDALAKKRSEEEKHS